MRRAASLHMLDGDWHDAHHRAMTLAGFPRIAVDPSVCGGRPIIVGTRMRVSDILEILATGAGNAEIAAYFPYVAIGAVHACVAYAAQSSCT